MAEIKNIWLVNKYAMPPKYESRLRTIKFAHYLQEMGYKVTIVAGEADNIKLTTTRDIYAAEGILAERRGKQ